MERGQFTFYSSYFSALSRIKKPADRAAAYDAIAKYALFGELPDMGKLPEIVALAFDLVKPTLDSSRKKAENGKMKGKQTGSKPEATESKPEAKKSKDEANESKKKQTESKTEQKKANRERGENANEGEKEKENEIEREREEEREKENECYNLCSLSPHPAPFSSSSPAPSDAEPTAVDDGLMDRERDGEKRSVTLERLANAIVGFRERGWPYERLIQQGERQGFTRRELAERVKQLESGKGDGA